MHFLMNLNLYNKQAYNYVKSGSSVGIVIILFMFKAKHVDVFDNAHKLRNFVGSGTLNDANSNIIFKFSCNIANMIFLICI